MDAPQIQPPVLPAWFVPRPRLFAALQGVFHHRLTLVVAGPGYGKSTLLAAWGLAMGCAWYTAGPADASVSTLARGLVQAFRRRIPSLAPALEGAMLAGREADEHTRPELLAGLICEALDPIVRSDLPLVIDSAEHLGSDGSSARLVEAICRQAPPALHVVLASRRAPPLPLGRQRDDGVLHLGPSDLAFSASETRELLATTVGAFDPRALEALHVRTGGWPAAVRLAVERIQDLPPSVPGDGPDVADLALEAGFTSFADEAFRRESPEVIQLLSRMSEFERFTAELCEALGMRGAAGTLDSLARRGLFVQYEGGASGWLTFHTLLREYAEDRWPLGAEERKRTLLRAADWFAERDLLRDALQALRRAGETDALNAFLTAHGERLLADGDGALLMEAGELVPPDVRSVRLVTLLGWALRLRGDWARAFEHYRRAAGDGGSLPGALAWRMVEAHYQRGELIEALRAAARSDLADASEHDRAMLLAWEASAHHRLGDNERAGEMAEAAIEIADRIGDDEARAAGHTAAAMVALLLGGDDASRDAHEQAAIEAADRAGDLSAHVRILVNRSDGLNLQGRFPEAAQLTETAIRLAESSGDPFTLARALEVRAEAALGQGRLTEAVSDGKAARLLYERAGSNMALETSLFLGRAHREAGELAASMAAYREGLRIGEETGTAADIQEGLAGLARVTVSEDPAEGRRLADRAQAVQGGTQHSRSESVLAAGWVARVSGDLRRALEIAEQAAAMPIGKGRRPRLAEAFEMASVSSPEPDLAMLARALDLWGEVGNRVGIARVELALATLDPASSEDPALLGAATRRLQALGVHVAATRRVAGLLATLPQAEVPPVEIRTLGGFVVVRQGVPVPVSEWKSRKARDLLKILVARRGLPSHREFLMEALWPEESPALVSNRLSVALAIVRSVLDPNRRFHTHHFVTGESESVRLNLDTLSVDVGTFVRDGAQALRGEAETEDGLLGLEAAESLYAGDFLEEDPYEDWAVALREEAKSLYVEICRSLATAALRAGRHHESVRYGLRLLSRDPFDEVAHLLIVRALAGSGRHGEARRRYRMYVAAIEEIGVTPSPYPGTPGS